MRVLVYGLSSDKLGGIETFLLNMNKFMSDEMVFDYVIEGNDTIHRQAIEEKGGKCYFIHSKRKMIQNVQDWIRLYKSYKDTSNIVYFNMYSLAWVIPIFLGLLNRYKVIVHAHNNALHDCGAAQKILHRINRFILGFTPIIRFTNSELSARFFFGKKPAEMIYNAIDTNRFSYNEQIRDCIRNQLEVQDKHLYGFSGRLAYQKNPLFLMDIFSEIKNIDENAAFIVCGEGNLADQTKQKANDLGLNVIFTGNVGNIQDCYQAMDCFILPSRFEGLGIVLIEAQCTGLPCLTTEDVVPVDAKITELLQFVQQDEPPMKWAQIAVKTIENNIIRSDYSTRIKNSRFNVNTESMYLEQTIVRI